MKWRAWLRGGSAPAAVAPRSAARTDVGRVRAVNEDRLLDRPDRGLWAVADGMGGLSGGDVAATLAVEALAALADAAAPITRAAVLAALHAADAAIWAHGAGRCGATIVAGWCDGARLAVFWAGDSRAYLIRDGRARLLTHDHSVVQDMVDAGLLAPEAAAGHPRANVVTRALGVGGGLVVDVAEAMLVPGDRVLLCSDGVSRSLTPRDFAGDEAVAAMADRLLANALERDGSDNATLVLIAA